MKLKIKVKTISGQKMPKIIGKGEWIDLRANETVELRAPAIKKVIPNKKSKSEEGKQNMPPVQNPYRYVNEVVYISLGVAMKLPDGFEAIIAPRSSSPKNFGFIVPNSFGVIDSSYCGNEDEWKLIALPFRDATISREDRVCQFRIQLSQKATFWQKLKWFFSNGIEFVQVEDLEGTARGGFGSTGTN